MSLDRIRRRGFLGGITAMVSALAGCGQNGESQTQSDTIKKVGTSTNSSQPSDSTPSSTAEIPPHDHSGQSEGGERLEPAVTSISEFQQASTYIIYKREGEIRALNGQTELEEFSGDNASNVIQQAINNIDQGGTIVLKSGRYEVGPQEIYLQSNIRLVGQGPGATILKLKDGINGKRGEKRSTVLVVSENVENVTIENLEIDGNESNNRASPSYPMSPHHHGILIHGSGQKVPEDRKPSNVLVRNVHVHDTVRSNIVLAGRNCRLENVHLSNSATDHWLYMGGATNCVVDGVFASGFARTEGIVLGTTSRRCSGNTISNVKISGIEETPYQNDEPDGFMGRFPALSFSLRPNEGLRFDNSIQNVDISIADAEAGQLVAVRHQNTKIQNLNYRGPNGRGGIVTVSPEAVGTRIDNATINVSGQGRYEASPTIRIGATDTYLNNVTIESTESGKQAGIEIAAREEPIDHATVRDVTVNAPSHALVVQEGSGFGNLVVNNLYDKKNSGVHVNGDVEFEQRNVY